MSPADKPRIPKKFQPRGYEILYEDRDVLVGNKAAGYVTVAAKWSRGDAVEDAVTLYLRKGNPRARNIAYVVHRLDQATTGALMFAKSEQAQLYVKENWKSTIKTYYAVVHGQFTEKSGTISSFLTEDEDYVVHSNDRGDGKLAQTEFDVVAENARYSLLRINLLTGRKNQIRVHMAEAGHPVVGDAKYGSSAAKQKWIALHSASLEFTQPHTKKRVLVEAPLPETLTRLVPEYRIPKANPPVKP